MEDTKEKSKSMQTLKMEEFASNLLAEKSLNNIDNETIEQMRSDLVDRLEQVTNRTVIENLPMEKLPEFEKMIDDEAQTEEIQDFIAQNIPNLGPKLTEAYFNFRKLYLGL